jgi:membrane protease subunit (stomatin/prohibitin family)
MPDDVKREIFEYSRLNKVDMQKLTQFKMANSIDDAVSNGNGLAGAGVGFGMGMGMGNMFSQQMQNLQNTPPPLAPFFVAVNGQQTGPFTIEQLSEMITLGNVKRETLIWKNGMAQWAAAGTVAELNNAFSLVPPPPPPAV